MQELDHYTRADIDPDLADTSKWPDVMIDLLVGEDKANYRRHRKAVEFYLAGKSHEFIFTHTRVLQQHLGDLVDRCLAPHPDGRIWGFRACKPYARVRRAVRTKPLPDPAKGENGSYAGAFQKLLNDYPDLEKLLHMLYTNKAKTLRLGQEVRIPIKSARKRFLTLCEQLKIRADQYPRNKPDGVRESIRRYFKGLHDSDYIAAAIARGDVEPAVVIANAGVPALDVEPLAALEVVEFDGHTIDLEVEVELMMPTPTGVNTPVVISRMTLLLLVDRASSAILAYQVVLHANYNKTDVLLCMSKALQRWEPKQLTIPGLQYLPDAGLPSGVVDGFEGACFDVISWDNHRTHLSPEVVDRIQETFKCVVNPGKHKTPLARALVELIFGLIEEQLHRLPGTTGSQPKDPLRIKQKGKKIVRLNLNEFEQIIDVIIANFNGTNHRRDFGVTPNEFIRLSHAQGRMMFRHCPEISAANLLRIRVKTPVRGNFKSGKRAHVHFKYASYHSPELAQQPSLIGQCLVLEFNRTDLRQAKAYLENGDFFGALTVERLWASTPHTYEQRVLIGRMVNKGLLDLTAYPDPVHAAVDYMGQHAPSSRRAASRHADLAGANGRPRDSQDLRPPEEADVSVDPKAREGNPYWKPRRQNWVKVR